MTYTKLNFYFEAVYSVWGSKNGSVVVGMGVGRIFSRGGNSELFQVVTKTHFSTGESTMVKFLFTNSKLREKHFSTTTLIGNYQMLKSRGRGLPCYPLAMAMAVGHKYRPCLSNELNV